MPTWIVTMPTQAFNGAQGHQHYIVEGTGAEDALKKALQEATSSAARAHRRDALINIQDVVIAPAKSDSLQLDFTDPWHCLSSDPTR